MELASTAALSVKEEALLDGSELKVKTEDPTPPMTERVKEIKPTEKGLQKKISPERRSKSATTRSLSDS